MKSKFLYKGYFDQEASQEDSYVSDAILKYPLTVDYDRTLSTIIPKEKYSFLDKYDVNLFENIFPCKKTGKTDILVELIDFEERIILKEVLYGITKQNYRPLELTELATFDEKYPDIANSFWIVGLGSVWLDLDTGRYNSPCMKSYCSCGRIISLAWLENSISDPDVYKYRFPIVKI